MDRRLCQTAAYTAALPTVRQLCQTKAALPDLGIRIQPIAKAALPTGGGFAKATIVELRLHLMMLAAFAGLEPGSVAAAMATWSAHLLDL